MVDCSQQCREREEEFCTFMYFTVYLELLHDY